jgi:hypothetical protein
MDAFHVVIDTSVLRQAHFQHPDFERLLRLSRKGSIKIYIPHIVLEEERTARLRSLLEALTLIESNFRKLDSDGYDMHVEGLPPPFLEVWSKEEVDRNSRKLYEKFLTDNKIELIGFSQTHAENVWRRYFGNLAPFDNIQVERTKRREHLPDAWIFEAAQEIKVKKGRHCVLVHDGNLKAMLATNQFEVFPDVRSFVDEVEKATAVHTLPARGTEPAAAPDAQRLEDLRAPLRGLDVIVLGMNEALKSPDKGSLFDALERAGIPRELAMHEAKTLEVLGIVTDTGSHLIPSDRALSREAAADPIVQDLL